MSMDRTFHIDSPPLVGERKKFTIVSTMKHSRKGIPKDFKSADGREEKSTKFIYSSSR